jgi:hypothetical protein
MDELDKKIQSIFETNKSDISTKCVNRINKTLTSLPNKKINYTKNLKLALATSCCSILLITGVVFAKDIGKILSEKFHSMGKGVSTAVQNGYVATSEMDLIEKDMLLTNSETGEIIDTIHTKAKIESAVVTEKKLGIELYFEFDSKLNEYVNLGKNTTDGNIDYENSHYFEFTDIFILDNENRILCLVPDGENQCRNYYKENNLEYPNNVQTTGLSNIIGVIDNSDPDLIKVTVELTLGYEELLKSTKLYVSFSEFNLIPKLGNDDGIEVKMKADDNWFMGIDIPEEMYNTTEEYYKVKSCENENFDVYVSKATTTGFEIGIIVTNEKYPTYPTKLDDIANNKDPLNGVYTREGYVEYYGEEYVTLLENYWNQFYLIRPDGYVPWVPWIEKTSGCYMLNSKGEKFFVDHSKNSNRTEPPSKENYWCNLNFSMTKFDATDEVTAIIDFKGESVKIELEK